MNFYPCFVPGSYIAARRRYPRAAVIAKVEGGFLAFASRRDYRNWRKNR